MTAPGNRRCRNEAGAEAPKSRAASQGRSPARRNNFLSPPVTSI